MENIRVTDTGSGTMNTIRLFVSEKKVYVVTYLYWDGDDNGNGTHFTINTEYFTSQKVAKKAHRIRLATNPMKMSGLPNYQASGLNDILVEQMLLSSIEDTLKTLMRHVA